jgi:hypothetical protein
VTAGFTTRTWCATVAALLQIAVPAATAGSGPPPPSPGEAIYRLGVLPSGEPLRGQRESGVHVDGADGACVNCHRRSGLGSQEGRSYIPPITGQFLFHPKAQRPEDLDLPYLEGARTEREPYTEATLARAIREGIAVDGRQLSYLMPRYRLNDAAMVSLIGYLRQLTVTEVPGVSETELQFATVITPDADPAKRQGVLAVLNDYFAEKNASVRAINPQLRRSRKAMYRASRRWQLHVWELSGPAATWEEQLQRHLAAEPVFAVISGLGGRDWVPVHRFCETAALPCLFPNVELPVVAESDFHSLYFSKGVLLEAGLIASQLKPQSGAPKLHRVVQIYREGDVGGAAAHALDAASKAFGLEPVHHVLKGGTTQSASLRAALAGVGPTDALVLWLRPADIRALAPYTPPSAQIWMSGQMGGLENAPLPAAWRNSTRMAYPFDLPERRRVRVDYPLGWFTIRHVPITDLQTQADTYLACGLLSEILNDISGIFVRDYLIERMESMLEHRVITGYYPRLALAPGQRFASKGGYIVRYQDPQGTKIVAVSDWIAP